MGEILFLCVLITVGLVMFGMAFSFPHSIIDKSGGPAFFPQFVVIVLCVLAMIRIIQIARTPKSARMQFKFFELFRNERLVYLVSTLLAIALMGVVGFIITMSLYLLGLILYLDWKQYEKKPHLKKVVIIVACSIVSTIFIDYLFSSVLNVVIPKGLIGF